MGAEAEGGGGERKLTAIMFTDMVGYTALTQTNEALALRTLDEHRRLLAPVFPRFRGRVVKTIGDSFLVEFDSALDAVTCALEIQKVLREKGFSSSSQNEFDKTKIQLRIGIHLGDVVHRGGDVYGDAVNIASRMEPLAEPGGVCVSEQVFYQVRNKLADCAFELLDDARLKNVKFATAVYRVAPGSARPAVVPSAEEKLDPRRLAVLPFENMSSDPADEYFADGMTEELISTLSRISGLRVISRTSAMQYKKAAKQIAQIGRELRVGTALEGSVRKAGNRVRITVQMIDTSSDEHLWAEKYDRELEDVFAIQSDIAQQVAESLKVKLLEEEKKQVERVATRSAEAHTLYLKGRYFWTQRTGTGLASAIAYFNKAIETDPDYALAYSGLADCYVASAVYGHLKREETFGKIREYALKAVELDDLLAEAHNSLELSYICENRWSDAEREFRRAIELNPNYATAHQWYAQMLACHDRFDQAQEELEQARELDPLSPTNAVSVAIVSSCMRRLSGAGPELRSALELNPGYQPVRMWLGLSYLDEGNYEQAIAQIRAAVPELPVAKFALAYAYARAGRREEALGQLAELEAQEAMDQYDLVGVAGVCLAMGLREEASTRLAAAGAIKPDFRYRLYPWVLDVWSFDPKFRESQREPTTTSIER